MLLADQAHALHLLKQMGPATGSLAPIPYQLPFCSIAEAAILIAQFPTEALVAAAAATTAVRNQQVEEFTTAVGTKAHAGAIAAGATE